MASRSRRGGRLKGFRLAEIDIQIRRRYARQVARGADGPLRADASPEARLFGALRDLSAHGPAAVLAAAEHPSDEVHWVSLEAWEAVMGKTP